MGIGPSTKETSKYRFEDPLLKIISADEELNLVAVIVQGTPQSEREMQFSAYRSAAVIRSMRADGAIVTTDGWGNSNIELH